MKNEIIEKIVAYFEENGEIFNDCIEELDSYDGYLYDDRYYYMEDLNELYHGCDPLELLQRAFFGWDEDSYTEDGHGNRKHDEFNPNREYFRYNGYGNLVSTNYKDYSDHLDHYAVERMAQYRAHIDSIESDLELSELFDQLEEATTEGGAA